jgi:outer membrane immunogenic protein
MNKLLLASLGAVALMSTGSAFAADVAVPIYKAPPIVYSSWTGVYAGVEAGYKWSDMTWNTTCLGLSDVFCPVRNLTGTIIDASNPRSFDPASARIGGYIGYNWQFAPSWLVGIEGDIAWADQNQSSLGIVGCTISCLAGIANPRNDMTSLRMLWDASVRGRLGFLPTPDLLVYVTGGIAGQAVEANVSCGPIAAQGNWCVAFRNETLGQTLGGYTLGGGVEYKWGNWIGRLEYRYSEFQDWTPTFFGRSGDDIYTNISTKTHMVNAGLAYLFNWGGPVVAKY